MDDGCDQLWDELSALADAFADLGRRLLAASRALHTPGVPPPEPLVNELNGLRQRFLSVRDRTRRLADGLGVPAGSADDLKSLAALLEAVETRGTVVLPPEIQVHAPAVVPPVPFLARGLAAFRPAHRLGLVFGRKPAPAVEPMDPVRS